MPYLTADVRTLIRSRDRFLELIWNKILERWVLIRYIPNCPGKYESLWVLEGPNGEFIEPRQDQVVEWLKRNDRSIMKLCSDDDRAKRFERDRHRRNAEIKQREAKRSRDEERERWMDHAQTAARSIKVRSGRAYTV